MACPSRLSRYVRWTLRGWHFRFNYYARTIVRTKNARAASSIVIQRGQRRRRGVIRRVQLVQPDCADCQNTIVGQITFSVAVLALSLEWGARVALYLYALWEDPEGQRPKRTYEVATFWKFVCRLEVDRRYTKWSTDPPTIALGTIVFGLIPVTLTLSLFEWLLGFPVVTPPLALGVLLIRMMFAC